MIRQVVAAAYGGPEVLAVQHVELAAPSADQVLTTVRAARTNPVDDKLYSGYMGDDPAALPLPVGMAVSGVVPESSNPGSSNPESSNAVGYTGPLRGGDEVIADAADVGHEPATLTHQEAAGLLLTGGTAWHLLMKTDVGSGDIVLIHGAGSGVGQMAVQLALARGATVIGTASAGRHDQLRRLGALPVQYGAGLADQVRAVGEVTAALDLVGADEALDVSTELVADRAKIATIAGFGRASQLGVAALTGANGGQAIRDAARPGLIELAGAGQLEVSVDKTFPLEQAAEAHRYLQTGHPRGKVVLVP